MSAKQLLPRDIGPRLLEASIYTERFRRTGDKEAYEAATKSLTEAESLSPQSAAVAAARFALLDAGGISRKVFEPSRPNLIATLRTTSCV